VSANVTFSLCAGLASLAVVVLAGLKGDWAVVAVYALLVVGFAGRAALGRRRHDAETPPSAREPAHDRRLRHARFRRR
jgi:hypothetical protein